MKNNHEIILKQYAAYCKEQPLYLGTAGSYGMEMLTIIREGVWAEYDILAAFHPPVGAAVQVRVGANNQIGVPIEATAEKGMGEIVFAGYKEGVRQIAVDVLYKVAPSSGASGTEPAEPTPDVVQQIMLAANAAEKLAQSVRDDADAGKFNGVQGPKGDTGPVGPQGPQGPQGPKGDTGPAVALDTTLTHEGEAADAKATGDAISAVKARQNILIGTETGNPLAVDDAFPAPLCGLTVYGRSTQDGTPTPDAPVPIVSAGDGGSVVVTLSDGNGKTQTLTLPTPNGLPGIPVASGGNYTDQSGQQWVCDEVDFEKWVKVQRVKSRRILSSEVKDAILGANSCYIIEQNIARPANNGQIGHLMCTHLERASWSSVVDKGAQGICVISNQPYIGITIQGFKSANEYKDFIDKNEVGLAYQLATPIETPLTPDEIAAYKALTAYGPDTVVQAGDGAGVKLDYQRDVNLVVKNLEDAIASMTTTQGG